MLSNFRILLTILLIGLGLINPSHGYRVIVGAVEEECFFDKVAAGSKIKVIYEVLEGGFLDIDFYVTSPNGEEFFIRNGDSSAKVTLPALENGTYTYCFSNQMSTVTPKEIKFSIDVMEADTPITEFGDYTSKEVEEIQPEKLEKMIRELRDTIWGIQSEQEYVEVRDRIHGRIQESSNMRVTLWIIFEAVLIFAVSVSQALYIKRFFEVRRVV